MRKLIVQKIQELVGDFPEVGRANGCSTWLYTHSRGVEEKGITTREAHMLHPASEQALGTLTDSQLVEYLTFVIIRYAATPG